MTQDKERCRAMLRTRTHLGLETVGGLKESQSAGAYRIQSTSCLEMGLGEGQVSPHGFRVLVHLVPAHSRCSINSPWVPPHRCWNCP